MPLMNRPQRDRALLQEAGVSLDRALFPLLIVIERKGLLVVELADLVGRDYTTVSRQLANNKFTTRSRAESIALVTPLPFGGDDRFVDGQTRQTWLDHPASFES